MIDDETLGAGADEGDVIGGFHRSDFDGKGGDYRREQAEDGFEVTVGNKLRVLSGDEEDVAESLGGEVACFGPDLVGFKGDAQDGVFAGKAAVSAAIDTFVREIERGEKSDGASKMAAGNGLGAAGEVFETLGIQWREVTGEGGDGRRERKAERRDDPGRIGKQVGRRVHDAAILYGLGCFCN